MYMGAVRGQEEPKSMTCVRKQGEGDRRKGRRGREKVREEALREAQGV